MYSPDASFILYIAHLIIDVQRYVCDVLGQAESAESTTSSGRPLAPLLAEYNGKINDFLRTDMYQLLVRWQAETETEDDIPTSCVIHAYLVC